MIVDLWLTFWNKILDFLLGNLPQATFPAVVTNAIDWLTSVWGIANFFIPMGTLALVISLIISLEIILAVVRLGLFLYKLIPGKAT